MTMTASEIVYKYGQRKLSARPEYYAGRGNNHGDLNSDLIEMVYDGIQTEVGSDAAKAFVNMVSRMTDDASATTFLVSLYRLERNDWKFKSETVVKNSGESLAESIMELERSGNPHSEIVGIFGIISLVSGGGAKTISPGAGFSIIGEFLSRHKDELYEPTSDANSFDLNHYQ
ncbi:MAG: hypothetical protein WBK77_00335 [Alphaproteobacteria bacterium]